MYINNNIYAINYNEIMRNMKKINYSTPTYEYNVSFNNNNTV